MTKRVYTAVFVRVDPDSPEDIAEEEENVLDQTITGLLQDAPWADPIFANTHLEVDGAGVARIFCVAFYLPNWPEVDGDEDVEGIPISEEEQYDD